MNYMLKSVDVKAKLPRAEDCSGDKLTTPKQLGTYLPDSLHSKEEVFLLVEATQLHLKLKLLETECLRLVAITLTLPLLSLQLTNNGLLLEVSKPFQAKGIL